MATSFEPGIDIVATAKAAGCDGVRVESPEQLGPALEAAIAANAQGIPFVVEVPVDQSHHHAEFDRFHGYEPLRVERNRVGFGAQRQLARIRLTQLGI